MDQKPPTQREECKSSKGTWVVWDLREENNIQMLDENKTTSENTSTFILFEALSG